MGEIARSALRQDVVSALLDSGAINLEAAGTVFSKFAESALRGRRGADPLGGQVELPCLRLAAP